MNWKKIETEQAVQSILEESSEQPVLVFKHSHRCSISSVALSRLERKWDLPESIVKPYLVDVVLQRPVSNALSAATEVTHESPQVLLIRNGKCIYNSSHLDISYADVEAAIGK